MSTTTVTIPNTKVELTVEQLIWAVRQLEPDERAKLAKALAETEMDTELARLIDEFYKQPPIDDISDEEIEAAKLSNFFRYSPLAGADLDLTRDPSPQRTDLEL